MQDYGNGKFFPSIIKGIFLSIIITLVCLLVFSIIEINMGLSTTLIKIINQFIKVVALFFGCFCFINESKGLLKGIFIGLIYCVIIRLIFALFGGEFDFQITSILDIVIYSILGGIFGIISVNAKQRQN